MTKSSPHDTNPASDSTPDDSATENAASKSTVAITDPPDPEIDATEDAAVRDLDADDPDATDVSDQPTRPAARRPRPAPTAQRGRPARRPAAADYDDDYSGEYNDAYNRDYDGAYNDEDDYDDEPTARRPRSAPARRRGQVRPAAVAQSRTSGGTVRTIVATIVALALLAGALVFGVLWYFNRSELNDLKAAEADRTQAEKVAADYAVGASTFDFNDLGPWSGRLTNGVSPDLKTKLDATVGAMNQLLQPLQWVSKGTIMDAVVNSQSGPIYKVSAYVRVEATNVQAPSGREVVTVYNVTLNKDQNWQITDVGGAVQPGGALPAGNGAAPTSAAPAPAPAAQAPAPAPQTQEPQAPAPQAPVPAPAP